jgi:chromosome partitioning protein
MITISIINMKGGVGKTTISVGLSFELAMSFGKKVLLIDTDPQTNATIMVLGEDQYKNKSKEKKTISDLIEYEYIRSKGLFGENHKLGVKDIIIKNPWNVKNGNLDIIPSSINLFESRKHHSNSHFSDKFFTQKLNDLKSLYDYCIIDSPPDLDDLVISALSASDYYIIPTRPDYLSQQGLYVLNYKLKHLESNLKCKPLGIVISMISTRASAFHKEIMSDLEKSYKDKVLSKIKDLSSYSKWPILNSPLIKKSDRQPFIEIAQKVIQYAE